MTCLLSFYFELIVEYPSLVAIVTALDSVQLRLVDKYAVLTDCTGDRIQHHCHLSLFHVKLPTMN